MSPTIEGQPSPGGEHAITMIARQGILNSDEFSNLGNLDVATLLAVISAVPDLKVCAVVLQQCREIGMAFPIKSASEITKLLAEREIRLGDHVINESTINRYLTKELFPVDDDKQLARVVYLGLCRCRQDMAWVASAPTYGIALLKEAQQLLSKSGG